MSDPRAHDSDDDAVDHAHRGATFDADEGDPDGAAFAGEPESHSDGPAEPDQPSEHGYGYE